MKHLLSIMQVVGLILISVACFMFSPILGLLSIGIELFGVGWMMEQEGSDAT